ncbi:Aquaporin [Lachnellula occidentalis]|uniref:Aquaporin n=1 Tax=Lachnellula occidentalis TaxID=215460 RepID=A0A8H8S9E1_9HELO|nr:Aquaporin [Lachnellula occidentalis]
MALDDSSDLPRYRASKISKGELILGLPSPTIPPSLLRTHEPDCSRRDYFPNRTPIPFHCGAGEHDRDRPSISSGEHSKKSLRSRDDGCYCDNDGHYPKRDDLAHHPDKYERSSPPRASRNADEVDRGPPSAAEPYFEARGTYHERDLERGYLSDANRASISSVSIDGYDYEQEKRKQRRSVHLRNFVPEEGKQVMRLPWTHWMNSSIKNHFVAGIGEFVGTTMFLFFAFAGTQVANIQSTVSSDNASTSGATAFNISVHLYIALIFGFSLMVNVWVFFRISGGLFNPAVTLGMVLVGAIPIVRAIFLFCAQIVGSITASAMVLGLFPTNFNVRTTLAGGTSLEQGVFIEAVLTAELVFTIFMLAKEKHKATFIAPVGIGLALFISEMVGVYYTSGSLNPARSFGPCVVTATFDPEHWIYWVGPFVGTCIAVFFYKFIKILEYEMANPGQDGDDENDPTKNEEKKSQVQARSRRRDV